MELKCLTCWVQACSKEPGTKPFPAFCPALDESAALAKARQIYQLDAETRRLARSANMETFWLFYQKHDLTPKTAVF